MVTEFNHTKRTQVQVGNRVQPQQEKDKSRSSFPSMCLWNKCDPHQGYGLEEFTFGNEDDDTPHPANDQNLVVHSKTLCTIGNL